MDTETQTLLDESNGIKADANIQFATGDFSQAISTYDRALASCPDKLDYEIAVLRSNIAACHIKLSDWKAAVESATEGLESLDRAEGKPSKSSKSGGDESNKDRKRHEGTDAGEDGSDDDDDDDDDFQDAKSTASDTELPTQSKNSSSATHPSSPKSTTTTATTTTTQQPGHDASQSVIELDPDGDIDAQLRSLQLSDERLAQIRKLRVKLLLRRAKANSEQAGWSTLAAAETDYRELNTAQELAPYLPARDGQLVRRQLAELPRRTKEAQEREVGEMMGKLKDLGNSFLKPFGLSTENFKMVKDEKTGGYSMSFENGAGGGGGGGGK